MVTRQITLVLTIASLMLALGCGGDTGDPTGGDTSGPRAVKAGFPESSYKKVESAISAGPDVLNEKMIKDVVSITPEASKVAISAVQAMNSEEHLRKLDALAGKIGMKDHRELLENIRTLKNAELAMESLLDLEERFADGQEAMIPGIYYDQCKKLISSGKLTRADLELMLKHMDTIKPVDNDLGTIAGTCLVLLGQ